MLVVIRILGQGGWNEDHLRVARRNWKQGIVKSARENSRIVKAAVPQGLQTIFKHLRHDERRALIQTASISSLIARDNGYGIAKSWICMVRLVETEGVEGVLKLFAQGFHG